MAVLRNSSLVPQSKLCFSHETMSIIISLLVGYALLMPLFFYVLVVGCQRWRRESLISRVTSWSHIDVFTYHVVVLELLNVFGAFLFFFGVHIENGGLLTAAESLFMIFISGQTLFHLLTCMERCLAVFHPVIYLRLKGSAGYRIRNVSIGCVWTISMLMAILLILLHRLVFFMNGLLVFLSSVAFFFCSLSVLCALIRPGPGEGGGVRERPDQSKKRALHTLIMITAALFLRFISSSIISIIQNLENVESVHCLIAWSSMWFLVPSSLLLPMLFLHRTGKLHIRGANVR